MKTLFDALVSAVSKLPAGAQLIVFVLLLASIGLGTSTVYLFRLVQEQNEQLLAKETEKVVAEKEHAESYLKLNNQYYEQSQATVAALTQLSFAFQGHAAGEGK